MYAPFSFHVKIKKAWAISVSTIVSKKKEFGRNVFVGDRCPHRVEKNLIRIDVHLNSNLKSLTHINEV